MDTEELRMLEQAADRFLDEHASVAANARWREEGAVGRDVWRRAGAAGLLGVSIPEAYGGAGADFRFDAILIERLGLKHALNFALPLHNAVVAPYIVDYANEEQKRRWLPPAVSGETILAVAMSEPSAGSDLQAILHLQRASRFADRGRRQNGCVRRRQRRFPVRRRDRRSGRIPARSPARQAWAGSPRYR
jgi:acyl-CoA dehydrogenase